MLDSETAVAPAFQEGIRDDLDAITRLTVLMELDNVAVDPSVPSAATIDWPRPLAGG
jgi:hypothetical protein